MSLGVGHKAPRISDHLPFTSLRSREGLKGWTQMAWTQKSASIPSFAESDPLAMKPHFAPGPASLDTTGTLPALAACTPESLFELN